MTTIYQRFRACNCQQNSKLALISEYKIETNFIFSLSYRSLDSRSIFLMDCGNLIMLYVGLNVPADVLQSLLG